MNDILTLCHSLRKIEADDVQECIALKGLG
jgi:hypothetical protein